MRRNQRGHLHRLGVMHDHALHELHIGLRPRRQRGPRRRRQRLARLTRRARLHHNRSSGIGLLLCARWEGKETSQRARCKQHATKHGEYSLRVRLPIVARRMKPPFRCTAEYFHLDSNQACHGILTFSKIVSRQKHRASFMARLRLVLERYA